MRLDGGAGRLPRLGAATAERPVASRPAPRPARARAKKIVVPQDRLTARRLFWRRVKRSMRPGLWGLAGISVLIVGTELVRSLPSAPPVSVTAPVPVAAPVRHGFGLAELGAAMGLRISSVQIHGAQTTDMTALEQAIGVRNGDPTLGFSLSAVQQRVKQLGAVQSATVARELPGTLIVTITERNAFAIWQTGGNGAPTQFQLIDKAGNVIANQDAAAAKRREPWLLLLAGADAPQNADMLMSQLQTQPALLGRVTAAERVDGLRWNLILKDQTVVKLPADGQADAIAQLGALQTSMQLLDRPVEVIDLRQAGRLVVRPYPAPVAAIPAKGTHK